MIPKLIDIKTKKIFNLDFHIYITDSGVIGLGILASHIDLELDDLNAVEYKLSQYLKSLPEKLVVLFQSRTFELSSEQPRIARKSDLESLESSEHLLKIFIEKKIQNPITRILKNKIDIIDQINEFISEIHLEQLKSIFKHFRPLNLHETLDSFINEEVTISNFFLNKGPELIGVLKLTSLPTQSINIETLGLLREKLPVPFELAVKQCKIPPVKSQANLKRKSKQEETSPGLVAQRRFDETQNTIAELELDGVSMHQFEVHVILYRSHENHLRSDLKKAKEVLSLFGEYKIETKGSYPSFVSTRPGGYFHVPILEKNLVLPCFLPITTRSDNKDFNYIEKINPGSLGFHRADFSNSYFYPFNENYTSYSINVIGQSGFGKSLFINSFLRSVLNEENASVILVDVKGSHTRTVNQLDGEIRKVNSDLPTGINPFTILKKNASKEVIEILLGFLSQLMLNDNEITLPVPESLALEKELLKYSFLEHQNPSLDDFLLRTNSFPRKEYLERFRSDGLFGNLFKSKDQSNVKSNTVDHNWMSPNANIYSGIDNETNSGIIPEQLRNNHLNSNLVYYDFESIQGAANKTVSTGIIAAVMADFNLRLIEKQRSEKLYLICDETPFFVKNCFSIFRLLIKNLRKLNGSLVLAAQKHEDLIVNEDLSLIEGAAIKFLFTKDGNPKIFKERLGLTDRDLEILDQFTNSPKSGFSKFLLKDELGSRIGLLRLTSMEYLRSTTSGDEVKKIDDAFKIAPHLSSEEIFSLLANNKLREVGLI